MATLYNSTITCTDVGAVVQYHFPHLNMLPKNNLPSSTCMHATVEKVLPQEFCPVTTGHQKQSNHLVTEPRALPMR